MGIQKTLEKLRNDRNRQMLKEFLEILKQYLDLKLKELKKTKERAKRYSNK